MLGDEPDIDQRRIEAKAAREKMDEFLSDSWRKSHGGSGVPPRLMTEQRAHLFAALAGNKVRCLVEKQDVGAAIARERGAEAVSGRSFLSFVGKE